MVRAGRPCARRAVRRAGLRRAAARAARARGRAASSRSPAWRTSITACAARRRTLDERFCRDLADELGLASEFGCERRSRARERAASIDRGRRPHGARYAFLEAAAGRLCGRRDCGRAQPGRSGGDVPAPAASRRRPARARRYPAPRRARRSGRSSRFPRRGAARVRGAIEGCAFREDETNDDLTIPRNRVRHELLPAADPLFAGCGRGARQAKPRPPGRTKTFSAGLQSIWPPPSS